MFKVGDEVMVRHHSQEEKENYENNWIALGSYWHPNMNAMEGKIYKIFGVQPDSYLIKDYNSDEVWEFAKHSIVEP